MSQYEIKNILTQLWPRTDVYARKPLAQKYMNVPRGPDGLFITFQWLIAMLSHTPTFKILDIVWKFLCPFVGLGWVIHLIHENFELKNLNSIRKEGMNRSISWPIYNGENILLTTNVQIPMFYATYYVADEMNHTLG